MHTHSRDAPYAREDKELVYLASYLKRLVGLERKCPYLYTSQANRCDITQTYRRTAAGR